MPFGIPESLEEIRLKPGASFDTGDAFSTGGRVAHGDFAGVGGAGGFATKVGLSWEPLLSTKPLPEDMLLSFGGCMVGTTDGAGDTGLSGTLSTLSFDTTEPLSEGGGGCSSGCGSVVLVPSPHVIASGAQSSSSSSISAHLFWP